MTKAPTSGPVYLDYNATTPVDRRVVDAMMPFLAQDFGNPSSGHVFGRRPAAALDAARAQVAKLIGASAHEIVFTGSGSEANMLALRGAVLAPGRPRAHLITQATEHPAVLETCRALARLHGVRVTVLPVESDGRLDPATLAAAFDEQPAVVSVMAANNETGVLQPISELAELAHKRGALLHCDAAQAAGKIILDISELGVDLLTVVGHKMYAPKGIGALYVREGLGIEPVIYGGGQERRLRAGTENVAFAAGFGVAAELAAADLAAGGPARVERLRDQLYQQLSDAISSRVHLNGSFEHRLPNTLNISVDGGRGHEILAATPQVAASTGSACHSGTFRPSPVLTAMGIDARRALGAIRLSLGRMSTSEDIEIAVTALTTSVTECEGATARR